MRAALLSLCVLCAAGACATNPVAKTPDVVLSESREIEIGRACDHYLVAIRRFVDDSAWERYVQQIGMRLVAKSARPGLPWTFRVLDDAGVNAFALPGGFVYITRGMLVYLNSEAQLAAVLGHEIAHVAAHHAGGQSARREMERRGLVVATTGGSMTGVIGDIEGIEALLLANSRHDEQEADALGLRYLSDAGYNSMEMLAVLHTLEHAVGSGPLPAWLTTHPTWERRIENITLERSNLRSFGALIERDAYLAHVAGLAFGLDRRQGYFQGSRFVVPAGGYQLTFPPGWTLSSDGVAARGESPAQDAVIDLAAMDQPSADSAARFFFVKLAHPRRPPTRAQANGLTVVSASFSWLPFWVNVRGSVAFFESRGTAYRVMGFTSNHRWSANQEVVERALGTLGSVPDSEMRQAEPLHVVVFALQKSTSLTALLRARPAPVQVTDLALINDVASDSVLAAGYRVKWIVGAPYR